MEVNIAMRKKRIAIYSVIALLLFFFFVPVYRTTVYFDLILPFANECGYHFNTSATPTVYASLSYVAFGHLSTSQGDFGLIYVPNYGGNSIQFPPIGFESVSCG